MFFYSEIYLIEVLVDAGVGYPLGYELILASCDEAFDRGQYVVGSHEATYGVRVPYAYRECCRAGVGILCCAFSYGEESVVMTVEEILAACEDDRHFMPFDLCPGEFHSGIL